MLQTVGLSIFVDAVRDISEGRGSRRGDEGGAGKEMVMAGRDRGGGRLPRVAQRLRPPLQPHPLVLQCHLQQLVVLLFYRH